MFGFDRKEKKRKRLFLIRQKVLNNDDECWSLYTKKAALGGNPCLVIPFVPKLLAHEIYLLLKMVDTIIAPRCNGSKE